jgi:hypothetical protein
MKLTYTTILCWVLYLSGAAQGITFGPPIKGQYLKDFYIANYVDLDTTQAKFYDNHCGTKTYDGHRGTDFALRNFRQMDSGVQVLAAATGLVIEIKDSLFDRSKQINDKYFGNYIAIQHKGNYVTYYAHLKKYSMLVKVGDSVKIGQAIALVGSSGNSTDPHLHFEVWYNNAYYFDPFNGTCQLLPSFWKSQLAYDSGYHEISSGLINYFPSLDTLRESPAHQSYFGKDDSLICFWIHNVGIHKGDTSHIVWKGSQGNELFKYDFVHTDQDWWYYYWWSYIYNPHQGAGTCTYRKTGGYETIQNFNTNVGLEYIKPTVAYMITYGPEVLILMTEKELQQAKISLWNMEGKKVTSLPAQSNHSFTLPTANLVSGIYILQVESDEFSFQQKISLLIN